MQSFPRWLPVILLLFLLPLVAGMDGLLLPTAQQFCRSRIEKRKCCRLLRSSSRRETPGDPARIPALSVEDEEDGEEDSASLASCVWLLSLSPFPPIFRGEAFALAPAPVVVGHTRLHALLGVLLL
jgi:hypothetical protein